MAHNLATNAGQVTMAYIGETPWHSLGQRMTGRESLAEALAVAGMDFNVSSAPLYMKTRALVDGHDVWAEVPDRKAMMRTDGPGNPLIYLGSVGAEYQEIQTAEALGILDDMVTRLGAQIQTVGALGNGAEVWALASLPGATIDATGAGDTVNGYFLARAGHTGNLAVTGDLTQVRVVCQNTMRLALACLKGRKPGQVVRVIHTKNASDRLHEAEAIVSQLTAAAQANGATFADLARRRMNTAEILDYIRAVFPAEANNEAKLSPVLKARRQTVGQLVWASPGAELAGADANGATAWAVFNAVTNYFDHVRPAEAKSDSGRRNAQQSAVFGTYNEIKSRAFTLARDLVAV